jgi:hypothetical protein
VRSGVKSRAAKVSRSITDADGGTSKGETMWTGRARSKPGPLVRGQIERFGREWAIAAGLFALGGDAVRVIVGDRIEPRLGGRVGTVTAQHGSRGIDMVEEGRQPFLEQRQPMVHAGPAAGLR